MHRTSRAVVAVMAVLFLATTCTQYAVLWATADNEPAILPPGTPVEYATPSQTFEDTDENHVVVPAPPAENEQNDLLTASAIAVYDSDVPEESSNEPDMPVEEQFEPYNISLSPELQEYTKTLCDEYNVDFEFALALMWTESRYIPNLISKYGDYGLMQINQQNHRRLSEALGGISDWLDPEQNIRAGIYVLAMYGDSLDLHHLAMCYNLGAEQANKLWDNGRHSTSYSRTIMKARDILIEQHALDDLLFEEN